MPRKMFLSGGFGLNFSKTRITHYALNSTFIQSTFNIKYIHINLIYIVPFYVILIWEKFALFK